MKNLSRRQRNNLIIAGLCAIVVLMGVGYAAFASQLRINGTSNISSNFNVLITDITSGSIVGGASNATDPSYTDTTATFSTNLVSPGDSITYTITVENQGTIDATLSSIDVNTGNNPAIEFETSGIEEGDNLLQGESDELYVKVSYSNSVTSQPENTNSTITVTLNYEQATGGIVPGEDSTSIGGQEVEIVSTGDGLYIDSYEEGKYIYKGANPNNYIIFNNELWRIISIENDNSIKIIKNESIGTMQWDSSNDNNWTRPSTLNIYLNETYLSSLIDSEAIVSHDFNIGAVKGNSNNLYNQISEEKEKVWQGQIGLISTSEYIRANSNSEQCGNLSINNTNRAICVATNWIQSIIPSGSYMWTINAGTSNTNYVFSINGNGDNAGYVYNNNNYANLDNSNVVPVLYLSSSITLTGSGTESDPYTIVS